MFNLLKNFLVFILIFLIIAGIFSLIGPKEQEIKQIDFSTLISEINQGEVKEMLVKENNIYILLKDGTKQIALKEPQDSFSNLLKNYGLSAEKLTGVSVSFASSEKNFLFSVILPIVLPFILMVAFFYFLTRQLRGAGGQAFRFGEAKAKEVKLTDKEKTTFKDVAGVKEAKEELREVVEFLKNPKKFTALGAKIPKGILLMGPPGTGKTILARAVAGEANVPFFHISASEFVEMFVGVGASRVRSLFQKAKKNVPCIVFIDELDAVGRMRGAGLGGGHDEREQTLNQILVELDGFEPNLGLIVLSATNRPDILDPALLRPGRFDRRVVLNLPDIKDREAILKIHTQNKPLAKGISLKEIAERTSGFSGADLANLTNEAAILAARQNKTKISQKELLESIEKVLLGPEKKGFILEKKERDTVAYHEAGHAIVSHFLPRCDPVRKISIVARGFAAGYTLKTPEKERHIYLKSEFLDNLSALFGGYAAEEEIFGEVSTGAANDLKMATDLSRRLVTEYGMSSLGPRTFGEKESLIFLGREIAEQRDYSEKIAELIDEEVSKFISLAYKKAKEIISQNKDYLKKIAELLLKKETIERKEFEGIFAHE